MRCPSPKPIEIRIFHISLTYCILLPPLVRHMRRNELPATKQPPPAIVVMGVSGSGKSTIGGPRGEIGATFIEGDDVHPPVNKAKMAVGRPARRRRSRAVARGDRASACAPKLAAGRGVVVACSALKRATATCWRPRLPASSSCTWPARSSSSRRVSAAATTSTCPSACSSRSSRPSSRPGTTNGTSKSTSHRTPDDIVRYDHRAPAGARRIDGDAGDEAGMHPR